MKLLIIFDCFSLGVSAGYCTRFKVVFTWFIFLLFILAVNDRFVFFTLPCFAACPEQTRGA